MTSPHLDMEIPGVIDAMGGATEAMTRCLEEHGVEAETVATLHLMLEEAVVNVIRYGYEDGADHRIRLEMEIQEDHVILQLTDDGREFDPTTAPPPDLELPHEERPVGGLGIHLMRHLCKCMTYERVQDRNRLTLQVPRPGGKAPGGGSCPCR